MDQSLSILIPSSLTPPQHIEKLCADFHWSLTHEPHSSWQFIWTKAGLKFVHHGLKLPPLQADFISIWRTPPMGKNDLFAKAIGRRHGITHVVDATAGLGGDTSRLLRLGCYVKAIEQDPVLYALLVDAKVQAQENPLWQDRIAPKLDIIFGDALTWLPLFSEKEREVIFLDPMFAQKNKKSLAHGEMQLLQHWLDPKKPHNQEMLNSALKLKYKRVVLKKPRLAPPSWPTPDIEFVGKAIRYEVWTQRPKRCLHKDDHQPVDGEGESL